MTQTMTSTILRTATSRLHSAKTNHHTACKGRAVLTLLFMLLTTATAGAIEYTIQNAYNWEQIVTAVNTGTLTFSGDIIKLGADISVSSMIGTSDHPFIGTFDGQGHTLTINYENTDNNAMTAPFSYVNGATIKNLVVNGTITGTAYRAAGIVGETGTNMSYITNCVSSVDISSGRYTGGFSIGGKVTITGCVFNGKINGTSMSGGFVGFSTSDLVIRNSLFAPQDGSSISGGTFYFNGGGDITPTNSYYTRALDTAQGKAMRSVTAGTDVTIHAIALGGATTEYSVSGITAYANGGIRRGTTLYYGSNDRLTLTLSNTATAPLGYQYGYTASAGTLSGSTLTMPDGNVTISVNTAEVSSDGQQHQVSYVDANGDGHTANAIALDGAETSLAAGTYFVGLPTVAFNHRLNLSGNVTLILKDGCTINVGTSDARINDYGIRGTSSEVTIYGQNTGNGTLRVYTGASNYYGVSVDNLTINGGIVKVNSSGNYAHAIYNFGNITINGGTVEATANGPGSYALYAYKTVTLNGGTVKATGTDTGIKSYASSGDGIVFAGAYVTASSYSVNGGTVRVASGLQYSDGTNIYTDATASATLAALTNTTLRLILPYLDENGTSQTCKNYYLLDGTETILGTPDKESWYAVQGTINYSECIYLYGNVKIILADGATMTVGTTDSPIENNGLYSYGSLGIYAQSTGSNCGRLSVVVRDYASIYVYYNFAIAGGQIEAINTGTDTNSYYSGIFANSVSLTNATVTATGTTGIYLGSDLTISGSTVTATGNNEDGIYAATGNISVINNSHVISHGNKRGMYAGSVTVNGSEVEAIKTGTSTNSYYSGIFANSVSLTNATVTATGTTGIYLGSDLTISGSTVTATGTRYYGINVSVANISISNSCHVISHGYEMGIYVEGNVTISGSEVEATMTSTDISSPLASAISANSISIRDNSTVTATGGSGICGGISISGSTVTAIGSRYYGIYARSDQDVTVAGGLVSITGEQQGIYSYSNNISLGWTNTSDYIFTSSYSVEGDGTLSVADGQTLIDGSGNTYSGTLTNTQISALAGKTLHPAILLDNDADNITAIAQAATLCEGGKQIAVQLKNRTLYKDGKWNTLCLPFGLTLSDSPLAGAEAREMSTACLENGTLTLNFSEPVTELTAGTPYIIKWASGDNFTPTFSGVTIDATVHNKVCDLGDGKSITFTGIYDPVTFDTVDRSVLFLGSSNTLYYPSAGASIKSCRAYFQLNGITAGDPANGVKAFVLRFVEDPSTQGDNFGDTETGIATTDFTDYTDKVGAWYTLDGRRLSGKPAKQGIYIHNGRKVTIK